MSASGWPGTETPFATRSVRNTPDGEERVITLEDGREWVLSVQDGRLTARRIVARRRNGRTGVTTPVWGESPRPSWRGFMGLWGLGPKGGAR